MLISAKMTNPTVSQPQNDQKRDWLLRNRGLFTRMSRELGVSVSFIADVFWGRRRSTTRQVEARLADLGAPGFLKQ